MKHLLYIGNKLAKHGYNPTGIDTLGPRLAEEGFQLHYASSFQNKLLRLVHMLAAVLWFRKASVVLIDTYSTSNFWFAYAVSQWCRLLQKPYIPILHGGNLPLRLHTHPVLCRQIFANAYRNVSPSVYLFEVFKAAEVPCLFYIPNTIESSNYVFKSRKNPRPKLLWVRALAELYHPEMALEVLSQLADLYPQAELCMVGPDKEGLWPKLKKQLQTLQINASYIGALSKTEWTLLASDFDFFINTSHFDNAPVSVIEAMGLGLVVVSTNVGGMPQLIHDGIDGFLVPDAAAAQMVQIIDRLMQHPELFETTALNARAKAASFDWSIQKKQWCQLLDGISE